MDELGDYFEDVTYEDVSKLETELVVSHKFRRVEPDHPLSTPVDEGGVGTRVYHGMDCTLRLRSEALNPANRSSDERHDLYIETFGAKGKDEQVNNIVKNTLSVITALGEVVPV